MNCFYFISRRAKCESRRLFYLYLYLDIKNGNALVINNIQAMGSRNGPEQDRL